MKRYSESEILEGVAKDQSKIIEYVYDTCFPVIEIFILPMFSIIASAFAGKNSCVQKKEL